MQPPSAQDILRVWEAGVAYSPLGRVLCLLSAVHPQASRDELAALDVARRDRLLLDLRESLFGGLLQMRSRCPRCATALEFSMHGDALRLQTDAEDAAAAGGLHTFSHGDVVLCFRLPTSADLADAAALDAAAARARVLQRCVSNATQAGVPVTTAALSEDVLGPLLRRMGERAAVADTVIDCCCPACACAYQSTLDIGSFLWAEWAAHAQRLLDEVHALASAYGWSERDILALPPVRRFAYLDRVAT